MTRRNPLYDKGSIPTNASALIEIFGVQFRMLKSKSQATKDSVSSLDQNSIFKRLSSEEPRKETIDRSRI